MQSRLQILRKIHRPNIALSSARTAASSSLFMMRMANSSAVFEPREIWCEEDLRLEWRGQDGQDETQKPYHSASLGDSVTSSIRIEFSVYTQSLQSNVAQM